MKITLIGCPFRTTYGGYISALRSGLERAAGSPVQWVASNCGCDDPIECLAGSRRKTATISRCAPRSAVGTLSSTRPIRSNGA